MFVCARDIVARTPDFDILAQNMTLRPWQWEMLHSFDDHTSLGAIARRIGVDLASITESLSALEQHGLIKIRTVTREEYRRVFEMAAPPAATPYGPDEDDDVPAARPPVEPTSQLKPVPATGEPLSVRLEALRAKAEQAQSQRPAPADAVPFQAQAAPAAPVAPPPAAPSAPVPMPSLAQIETAELMTSSAAVEAAQAPPEPPPSADGFSSKLADLKARLDEALSKPVEAPPAAEPEVKEPERARGGLADFTDALSGNAQEIAASPDTAEAYAHTPEPVEVAEPDYAPVTSLNGNSHHETIAFSLTSDLAPKAALSPDAIEFSLGGPTPEPEAPPKPPPLKY
jgi:hypothetical protein